MGMYLMRQIGTRGVYAHPILPDFMVFLNWKELPWYWYGFDWFPFAALMVLLVPGVLAFVFGWFAFRSRVTGVYLSIITQALTFALMLGFFRNDFGFGGNNGLTDFKDILGFNVQAPATRAALFALSAVALGIGYLIAQAVVRSKAGKVLIAVRDAESRTRFLGYRVENYKTFVFTLSACMAGVAGALYVPQVGIINPSEFAPANSIEVVIWVAVGGRGTLIGAALGAVIVNYAKTIVHHGAAGALLAVRAGRAVRAGHAVPAQGHPRPAAEARARRRAPMASNRQPAAQPAAGGVRDTPWTASEPVAKPREITQSLLYLDGVTVSFDGFRALNNLSLELAPGEMRAIIGPNGAGKTTMMDVITGKTRPDNGDVLFDNGSIDLTTKDEAAIAQLGIGRKFQKPTVFDDHTVEDNVLLALKGDRTRARATCSGAPTAMRERIDEILEDHRRSPPIATAWPAPCRTARSSGSRSACCSRRTPSCCWSTSRSPA